MSELKQDTFTFGKYKGKKLQDVLRDRKYCEWLVEQDWFLNNYEYLYNRVSQYNPKLYFFNKYTGESDDFLLRFKYFNLTPVDDLKLILTEKDTKCYIYYLSMINGLRDNIKLLRCKGDPNPYNIKAPVKWLQRFEADTGLLRSDFKDFIDAHELPNIPYIIEDIKKEGGIEYKGAKSFTIAKKRSKDQEEYWEGILKEQYGEDVGTQYKYKNCVFDFINIKTNTIFECKLGMKDFNEEQHRKYLVALEDYRIVYLIGYDCVVHMEKKSIYTTDHDKYISYQYHIPVMNRPSKFDELIVDYQVKKVRDLRSLFGRTSWSQK